MTVTTTISRNDYIASAAQTVFPYTFKIFVDSDLGVYVDGAQKMLSTHYTVSGAGGSGGNVTFLTPMAGGENIAIIRDIPLTQETDYVENDPFPAETHEAALDKLTMLNQQVDNRSLRSIRIPNTDVTGTLTELPINTERASKYLAFDTDGDVTVTALPPTGTAVITSAWESVLDDTTLPISIETIRSALTNETSPATDDEFLIRDTSATTGKRMTFANWFKVINSLTAETAPAVDDFLSLYDTSASSTDKISLQDFLKIINSLTEDTAPDLNADYILSYDTSASSAKKVLIGRLAGPDIRTPQTLSGTSVDFTSIPSWAKKITVQFSGLSTNGTSIPILQLGDSGGIETTGYLGTTFYATVSLETGYTSGILLTTSHVAAAIMHGIVTLTLVSSSTNTWAVSLGASRSDAPGTVVGAGSKSLSATLDRVRFTTVNGTDAYDAGTANILFE